MEFFELQMKNYLKETELVNFSNPLVKRLALELAKDVDTQVAKRCFLHVRDKINHSGDIADETITTY
jgi:hypothetical protein